MFAVAADEPALQRFAFDQPHMGTRFRIVLYAASEADARAGADAAYARIAALNDVMSDYKSDSELMKLCARAGGPAIGVSEDLFTVLAAAQDLSRRSEGAFDVTVGPFTQLWRLSRRTEKLPAPATLAAAKALVGFEKVRLDAKARTVELTTAGMKLDLGGIAKGFAADEALKVLRGKGINRALVAAGGDIAVGDAPPQSEGWRVGIAPLEHPTKPATRILLLTNAAVSTAGDTEQFVEIEGVRYSHILDPRTGLGLVGRCSITVVAARGLVSDGLDTAACVLGPVRGMKLVDDTAKAAGLYIRLTEKGEEVIESKRWKELKFAKE